jgi:uncharacterized protein (DUF2126 family)
VVGYALPLRIRDGIWQSGPWTLRRELLYLLPGDSPMGYRLPLDRLALGGPEHDPSGSEPWIPLVRQGSLASAAPVAHWPCHLESRPTEAKTPAQMVRTALCLEARDGMLHVFLPPVSKWRSIGWNLVAAIETAAAATGMPVRLEGYPPPRDPRLTSASRSLRIPA